MFKRLRQWQIAVLAGGTIFAFYTIAIDFLRFYDYEGTLFKVNDCIVPNPVTTPCFYGGFAFLIATIWAWKLYKKTEPLQARGQKHLTWFLVASNLFAWGNFSRVAWSFYHSTTGATIGCSGVATTNPYTTPCFIGSAIFLIGLVLTLIIVRQLRHAHRPV